METPPVPVSERMRFRARLRTRWSDEDTQGVLNHAVYATLLEEARHALFTELGQLRDNHFPFLLAQLNLRFLAPGRGSREVEVELATTHLGRSSFEQVYRIRDVASGVALCEAHARLVCYDAVSGRSRPMQSELRAALAQSEVLER
jgi:acyl-CoA thioester hydrolase